MNFRICLLKFRILLLTFILFVSCSHREQKSLTILLTTDIHGGIFPYDFIEKKPINSSLAGVSTYVKKIRDEKRTVVLLDDGDNLQGQPAVYYYNYIDTLSPHLNAEVMNYLGYDAGTLGNHDIEAGHSVYDKLVNEYKFPLLAANAVNTRTGKPYFNPYTIIKKEGIKVAVLGMITPAVPSWLPPELYSGIEFRGMVETAKKYMPSILKEKPDLVIGMFHSGWDNTRKVVQNDGFFYDNSSFAVAQNVPGFDIILCGHDHRLVNEKIVNSSGDTVLILDGGSRVEKIARADVIFFRNRPGGKKNKFSRGEIIDLSNISPDPEFMDKFKSQKDAISRYVDKAIATSKLTFSTRDSYFGSSPFVDLIHLIQLDITHADVSFAAPLSFDVKISEGPITVGDMFKLYRFENMLYTMTLSGMEIKKYLEFSYSKWFNTMNGPGDNLLKFRTSDDGKPVLTDGRAWLLNPSYDFDSAAGIIYTVDVSKPEGERISIKSFSNGNPFDLTGKYFVAVNSYRGNGGGGHLTDGAGINTDDIHSRLVKSTEKDLKYYILKYLETQKTIKPVASNNWKIIPEKWAETAIPFDHELLFGK